MGGKLVLKGGVGGKFPLRDTRLEKQIYLMSEEATRTAGVNSGR